MRNVIWLSLLCLTGCEAGDLSYGSLIEIDRPLDAFGEHTEVVQLGQAWLSLDGAPTDHRGVQTRRGWGPKAVVDQTEDRLQILQDVPHARVLLWLDTADLGLWVMNGALGAGRPGGDTSEAYLRFDADTQVKVVETLGSNRRLESLRPMKMEGQISDGVASAWMSVNKLAPFYVAHGHDEAEDLDRPVWLRPGAVFLDAPDGEPLYALRPQESMSNNPIYRADWVSTRSAHVLVDLALRGGQVRGWIRQDELSFDPPGGLSGGGSSSCGGFGATFYGQQGPTVQLSAGTILFADVDGDYVGETTEDHDWFLRDEQDGWTGVQLDTPWGGITAWVMPE